MIFEINMTESEYNIVIHDNEVSTEEMIEVIRNQTDHIIASLKLNEKYSRGAK